MNKHHQILIVGGGTAGITVAAQLARKDKKLDVALIDPAEKHHYQAAWTLVGAGVYRMKNTERPMRKLIPRSVRWIQDAVVAAHPDRNELLTKQGDTLTYDYLVLCPGAVYDFSLVEGLAEAIDRDEVCSNYTNPEYTWEVLRRFKGGNALFTQAATPIKCGGAPQKIMYLAEDLFQRRGVRDKSKVLFVIPGSTIFGTEPFRTELMKVVDRKRIQLRFYHRFTKIDAAERKAYYTISAHLDNPEKLYHRHAPVGEEIISPSEVAIPYDMMHLAPPHTAPAFITASPLAIAEGPAKGWIDVDHFTLQHRRYPNVFALGDAADLPTAKTGAAIRKQAPVLVANLLHFMRFDDQFQKKYNGYSSCPLTTGYGKMLLAEFGYGNQRMSDPFITRLVDTSKEHFSMWLLKKYSLPFMYWNFMMKGRF